MANRAGIYGCGIMTGRVDEILLLHKDYAVAGFVGMVSVYCAFIRDRLK